MAPPPTFIPSIACLDRNADALSPDFAPKTLTLAPSPSNHGPPRPPPSCRPSLGTQVRIFRSLRQFMTLLRRRRGRVCRRNRKRSQYSLTETQGAMGRVYLQVFGERVLRWVSLPLRILSSSHPSSYPPFVVRACSLPPSSRPRGLISNPSLGTDSPASEQLRSLRYLVLF